MPSHNSNSDAAAAVAAVECALEECSKPPVARGRYCSKAHQTKAAHTRHSIRRKNARHAAGLQSPTPIPTEPAELTSDQRQIIELRAVVRRAEAARDKAKAKSEDLVDAVYQAAKDAATVLGPIPSITAPVIHLRKGSAKNEMALLHTTDWQYGKLTDTYSMAVCEERIALLCKKVALLVEIQRSAHPVDDITVMIGGDIVEGLNIFPGQAYEVEESLYAQMFGAVRILVNLIRYLLTFFKNVYVIGEPGNHGRLGRRGEWPARDNTDRMVYGIARGNFTDEPRVHWQEDSMAYYQMVQIGNYRAMLIHGDEIKSFGGNTPAFGLLRKGTAWSSGVVEGGFQDIYFGHYHTPMMLTLPNGGKMYGTGSTESDNAYAAEFVAAKGKPSQRLHFIDPRKSRVTAEYQIYLDEGSGNAVDEEVSK